MIPSIRDAVRDAYSAVADRPGAQHAFPCGRAFAESLGYGPELLDALPRASVDAFAGVSNVSLFADLQAGQTALDLGCGAGMDSMIAARRVGPTGRVLGVDFSAAMLERTRPGANVLFLRVDAEQLPLRTASIDVALVNGIFNLNPAQDAIVNELARVVRSGGSVFGAELLLRQPLPAEQIRDPNNWFA